MGDRLVERYSRVERDSSRLEGLYGDSKEVRVMAGNGNDRHDNIIFKERMGWGNHHTNLT
jgi:hypothetical protein